MLTPGDAFGELLLSLPVTLASLGLKAMVSKGRTLPQETLSKLNFKLHFHMGAFNPHVKRQGGKKKSNHLGKGN